jgi:hypothetical protein
MPRHPEADAILHLLQCQREMLRVHEPMPDDQLIGAVFSKEEIEGYSLLNHAITYLEEGREKYAAEIHPSLYGYIKIS